MTSQQHWESNQLKIRGPNLDFRTSRLTLLLSFLSVLTPRRIFLGDFCKLPRPPKWCNLYHHYSHAFHNVPIPGAPGERTQSLLALNPTCGATRYRILPEVLEWCLICPTKIQNHQIPGDYNRGEGP